ncbi:MAG TPA: hypothetical protein VHR97_07775 [Candidatus Baltobacteraceae bacterium]|jgi:hypothetical protein|nr:hypothetical protein [Candidatus Baltobacteraceae bacterium]
MKKLLFTLALAACPASPILAAAATPAPDSAMLAKAKATLVQLQSGKLDRSALAPSTSGALSDTQVTQVESLVGGLGPPVNFTQQQAMSQGGNNYAVYTVTFQNGTRLNYVFSEDSSGQITGFRFTSAP